MRWTKDSVDNPHSFSMRDHSPMCLCMPGNITMQSLSISLSSDTVPCIMFGPLPFSARSVMLTSICLKKVLSPFSVFGVVGIRHQVGVLIGSQGTIDGEVQGVLTHDLLTQAVVHVSQPTIVGFL